jgi:hypothetical protein
MKWEMETVRGTRLFVLQLVSELTVDQLNKVPQEFNNNIIWNLGHLVAAQQGVCYLRAGLQTKIPEAFYRRFKPDTRPEGFIDAAGVEEIKNLLLSTLDQFEADYEANLFTGYKPWTTRYGAALTNIDEAVQFLLFHEGLHTGYIMGQKRLVKNTAAVAAS